MSYLINNQQKLNEIIFANRNKSYGAYVIRSTYGFTILKSLGFMILGFSTVISLAWYISNRGNFPQLPDHEGQVVTSDTTIFDMMPPEEQEKKEKQKAETPPPSNNSKPTDLPTEINYSLVTEVSKPDSVYVPAEKPGPTSTVSAELAFNGGGKGTNTTVITSSVGGIVEPLGGGQVDVQPEFEGGIAALLKFIKDNLKYPEEAEWAGKSGTVYVRFVVDETGKVGSVTVVRAQGYGMDKEATRVVSMIPKFKSPAKKDGQAVRMYYHLPIKFAYNR